MPDSRQKLQLLQQLTSEAADAQNPRNKLPDGPAGETALREKLSKWDDRFGSQFSNVKTHAAAAATPMGARAFTSGNTVAFSQGGPGQVHRGANLLAHELTHIVQQNSNSAGAQQDCERLRLSLKMLNAQNHSEEEAASLSLGNQKMQIQGAVAKLVAQNPGAAGRVLANQINTGDELVKALFTLAKPSQKK